MRLQKGRGFWSRLRFFSLALAVLATASTSLPAAAEAYDGWVYRQDLGGWLDSGTGLVWGGHSAVLGTGSWSYNGANNKYLPNLRNSTGIAAWRLPTKAEVEDASRKGVHQHLIPPTNPMPPPSSLGYNCWTSTTRGRSSAYVANVRTGGGGYYSTSSYTNIVPVYRAPNP